MVIFQKIDTYSTRVYVTCIVRKRMWLCVCWSKWCINIAAYHTHTHINEHSVRTLKGHEYVPFGSSISSLFYATEGGGVIKLYLTH